MQEYYKILGLNEGASREEVETAYRRLKDKYSRERFLEGEAGNEAARRLTQVETAYSEIINGFQENDTNSDDFKSVEEMLKNGRIEEAQRALDNFSERNGEWHYLQSVVFYKKNWMSESKKQLEIAMEIEPSNQKYKDAYKKLKDKIQFTENQFKSGNASYNSDSRDGVGEDRQMGGDFCADFSRCCATWCCINCLCNGCR